MNKQIEEMANDLRKSEHWYFDDTDCDFELDRKKTAKNFYTAGYRKLPKNIGEFSDGYHTFNELYHHRAVLFSVICNMMPDKAWKSKLHDTGDMYDGMFIVGIETEQGQATYHYDIDPYWDMFKVKELERAPKWDGHTPAEAIQRIGNLSSEGYRKQSVGEWYLEKETYGRMLCSNCREEALVKHEYNDERKGHLVYVKSSFCPNCGARMKGDEGK